MPLLLDTHAFIWFTLGDERLPMGVRTAIESEPEPPFVSVASCWEIAIKFAKGRLALDDSLEVFLRRDIDDNELRLLPIERPHLVRLTQLFSSHGDPFDRLIAAQALSEGLTIVSRDFALDGFGVSRLW